MPSAVTDTHALIWYLENNPRLSPAASQYFTDCEQDGGQIHIPSICIVEMVYLGEKGRISTAILNRLLLEINNPVTILKVVDLDLPIAMELATIPRTTIPDMPDRIIAATAKHLILPLISRDSKIQMSGLTTVW